MRYAFLMYAEGKFKRPRAPKVGDKIRKDAHLSRLTTNNPDNIHSKVIKENARVRNKARLQARRQTRV